MIEKLLILLVGFSAAVPIRSIQTATQDHEPALQTMNLHGYGSKEGLVKATEEKLGVSIADFVAEYINANRENKWIRDCLRNPSICKNQSRTQKPVHGRLNKALSNSSPRRHTPKQNYDSSFPDYDSGSEVEYHYVANRPD